MVEDGAEKITAEEYVRQKRNWENELERIRSQLHNTQMVRKYHVIHKSNVMSSYFYNSVCQIKHEFGIFSFLATRRECRRSFEMGTRPSPTEASPPRFR